VRKTWSLRRPSELQSEIEAGKASRRSCRNNAELEAAFADRTTELTRGSCSTPVRRPNAREARTTLGSYLCCVQFLSGLSYFTMPNELDG